LPLLLLQPGEGHRPVFELMTGLYTPAHRVFPYRDLAGDLLDDNGSGILACRKIDE